MRTPRTIETILAEIDTVAADLDSQAACSEELGTASPALVATMRALRVPMIKAPVEVGGDHLGLEDQLAFFERLSYWNPTAAWTGFNHAGAAGMAGAKLSDAGAAELFGDDAAPFMAAVSAPSGTYTVTEGGIILDGRWKYASGVPHSEWILLTALGKDTPGVKIAVVERSQIELAGEWNVIALRGTGSIDVIARSVFVPDHRIVIPSDPIRRGGKMYNLGYQAYVAPENLGFTLGVCQRFIDEIVVYAQGKARGFDGRLADRGAFKYELGKAQLQLESARGYARDEFRAVDALLHRGEEPTSETSSRLGGVIAYATETAVGAVTNLFHFAGAGALFESSVLQRCFRDAVGSHQHLMASNIAYDRRGELMLAGAH
jgi:alkylation response protein AidB-like acyl-CoA dehydrogenase